MPIKSFRGLIADSTIDTISLHTNTGSSGYRIKKFEVIPNTPGAVSQESVCKIYKIPQTGIPDGVIDFNDNTLLGAAYYQDSTSAGDNQATTVIFDNEIFNQDIFVTYKEGTGTEASLNYYIELEMIKLDLNENTVATLKDIRNIEGR